MTKAKRIRWSCPIGEHPGALAPTRLRKIDIRRFCIPCSEYHGVLVERVAPALKRRKKKPTKKPKANPIVCGIDVLQEVRRIEALEVVAKAYENLERRPVSIQVRCRKTGDHTTGSADWRLCNVALTYPQACSYGQVSVLIAHEIAHIATANKEGHGAAWRYVFLAVLRDGYNLDVGWPTKETGERVDYNFAHDIFEQMMDEQHGKDST